jgi:acetyltransferase-like isoleucine patch superfamily enzyme
MNTEQAANPSGIGAAVKPTLYRRLATSDRRLAQFARGLYRAIHNFSVPVPKAIVRPFLWVFLAIRTGYHFVLRVFICEPLFKAYCTSYGKNLRTDCHLHWISGQGDIVIGNNVWLDGKINITFAARFADRPRLEIGDNTGIGHGCRLTIGKLISIGRNCNLSGDTLVMDSNGHDTDPRLRLAHAPPVQDDVRPVIIRDGVWIGVRCIIFPGVRIGEGSVVAAGSVVRSHVPPYSVVSGNPAKVMFRLKKPDAAARV